MSKYTSEPMTEQPVESGRPVRTRNIGQDGHMVRTDERMPAFAALAKQTGGLYVEDENGMTIDAALSKAGLDFDVEQYEAPQVAVTTDDGIAWVDHPLYKMNVARHADGRLTPVGMVKGRYEVVQNRDAYAFAEIMLGEGGANVAAAGSYGSPAGSRTYLALALEPFTVGGVDEHQMFVTILNSHDGTTGLVAALAPIRLTCTNQLGVWFGRGRLANKQRISLRHTKNIEGRIEEARQVLGLADRWLENFQKAADVLLDTSMTDAQFRRWTETVWPKPKADASKRTQTVWSNRSDDLAALFANAATNEFGRGTRYAAYNAVTEYLDWFAPVRGGDSPEVARFTRTLDGDRDELKARAFTSLVPESARKELMYA